MAQRGNQPPWATVLIDRRWILVDHPRHLPVCVPLPLIIHNVVYVPLSMQLVYKCWYSLSRKALFLSG